MSRALRCGVYVRKSRKDRDKEAHRLEVQREQLPAFASSQGWQTIVYDDGFASGADQAKLPRLQDLITEIRARRVDVVLCIEYSRLSRDDSSVQYLQFIDLCRGHGVKLATPGQLLDPDDPSQWLILLMQGGISSVEMQQLKRRMAEGRDRAKRAGRFLGGRVPWPYHPVGGKKVQVTAEDKETARLVLDQLQHRSVWDVARAFPSMSLATLTRMTSRSRLLFYAGKRELPDGTLVPCDWEPIITDDEMQSLRTASAARLPYRRTGHEAPTRLLTGLGIFFCAYCGHTMKGHTDKKTYRRRGTTITHHYYRCNRFKVRVGQRGECKNQSLIPCAAIDEPLLLHVQHTLDRVTEIKAAFERAVRGPVGEREPRIHEQLRAAQVRRDRLVERIASGLVTDDEARPALGRIRDEIRGLEAELQHAAVPPDQLSVLDDFQAIQLADYSLAERRELLSIVVQKVELRFDRMFVTYNLYEVKDDNYISP